MNEVKKSSKKIMCAYNTRTRCLLPGWWKGLLAYAPFMWPFYFHTQMKTQHLDFFRLRVT